MRTEIPDYNVSRYFITQGVFKEGMLAITFINGMNNKERDAFGGGSSVNGLSRGNLRIDGIYNHSNGIVGDALEIILHHSGDDLQ